MCITHGFKGFQIAQNIHIVLTISVNKWNSRVIFFPVHQLFESSRQRREHAPPSQTQTYPSLELILLDQHASHTGHDAEGHTQTSE